MKSTEDKVKKLSSIIENTKELCVAFSGGCDSAYLLYQSKKILGEKVLAVTAELEGMSLDEKIRVREFCEEYKINHKIIKINELSIPEFAQNPENRCYICKKHIFSSILDTIKNKRPEMKLSEGSNADDNFDDRPGMKAIIELGVISPLRMAGLTKKEIRRLSRQANLITADIPSNPCFSTRIPHGELITKEKLIMVEKAEEILKTRGITPCRVRNKNNKAVIETADSLKDKVKSIITEIEESFLDLGFTDVSLDSTKNLPNA